MIITPSSSFIRPADTTAYASGDLVANSTTAGNVVPLTFDMSIKSGVVGYVRLRKSGSTATSATFALHIFTERPIVTNGDNGALAVSTEGSFLGTVACDLSIGAFAKGSDLPDTKADRRLFGLLEATAAYTPASGEVFTAWLEIGDGSGR